MKEKWSVGTYIVPLQNRLLSRCETLIAYKPYKIIRNYQIPIIKSENGVEINFCSSGVSVEEREGIRWFETYEEALKFSNKSIKIPDYVECISSELSYIKPGVIYKFECKTDLRSLLLKCNVDSLHTAGTALFASITSFNFKESNELAYNKQKKVITTFPEVWEFKFETEEELKVVGDFLTNSLKNGVDYANRSKIGGWVSYPNFGCGRIKGAVRISFEQFKERYITDIPKEDCSKTSERDIFNTNLLNEAKRRYPVGTLFSSTYQGDECIVVELFFKEDKNYGRVIQNSKCGWVYCDGNGWADIKALPKDFVPEYIECIEGSKEPDYIIGKIYKVPKDGRIPTESGYIPENVCVDINDYYGFKFKPSTKEAFDAQNKPKPIDKWSVGTYVAFLKNLDSIRIVGFIDEIISKDGDCAFLKLSSSCSYNRENKGEIKWFATKSEAEEFAKTLIEDKKPQELTVFPSEGCCKFDKQIEDLLRKNHSLYESSKVFEMSKVKFICWNSEKYWYSTEFSSKKQYSFEQLKKFFIKKEVKQPLKQAVHCKTQEEWDFVLSKLPTSCLLSKQSNKFVEYNTDYKHENGIAVNVEDCAYCGIGWYKSEGYQILSFQEWCDLNGYKMEKEVKFEVGKWYKNANKSYAKCKSSDIPNVFSYEEWIINGKFEYHKNKWYGHSSMTIASLEEIQQYLPDGHPDKIAGTKVPDIKSETPNLLKTFQLPHEWCIKTTAENQKEIADWRTSGCCGIGRYCLNQGHVKSPYKIAVGYAVVDIPEGTIEISTEEFRKYVLNKKENPKLNIGDWVYCTHSSGEDLGYETNGNNRDIIKGYVGKITGFFDEVWTEDSVSRWVQLDGNNQDGVVECLLRLATPEEIKNSLTENPKSILDFRVGQWVRITKSSSNWAPQMDVFDGKIVQITAIRYGCIQFKGSGLYCWVLKDKHFRSLTQEESLLIESDSATLEIAPVKSVYQNLTIKEDDTEIIFLPEPD